MIIALIILIVAVVFLTIFSLWQMHKLKKSTRDLRNFNKKVKQERAKILELELATTQQIVHELVRRPNLKFILLIPHTKEKENLYVEIHSSNIPLPMALGMLQATYQGVIETLRQSEQSDTEE